MLFNVSPRAVFVIVITQHFRRNSLTVNVCSLVRGKVLCGKCDDDTRR